MPELRVVTAMPFLTADMTVSLVMVIIRSGIITRAPFIIIATTRHRHRHEALQHEDGNTDPRKSQLQLET